MNTKFTIMLLLSVISLNTAQAMNLKTAAFYPQGLFKKSDRPEILRVEQEIAHKLAEFDAQVIACLKACDDKAKQEGNQQDSTDCKLNCAFSWPLAPGYSPIG